MSILVNISKIMKITCFLLLFFSYHSFAVELPLDNNTHINEDEDRWLFTGYVKDSLENKYFVSISFAKAKIGFLKLIAQILVIYDERRDLRIFKYHVSKLGSQPINSTDSQKLNLAFGKGHLKNTSDNSFKVKLDFDKQGVDASIIPKKEAVLTNGNGKLKMGKGGKANAYCIPRMKMTGDLWLDNKRCSFTGECWYDRQFGKWKDEGEGFKGWDWFNIQLDNNTEMVFIIFKELNTGKLITPYSAIINSNGKIEYFDNFNVSAQKYFKSSNTQVKFPTQWQIELPSKDIKVNITAKRNDHENVMSFLWIKRIMWDGIADAEAIVSGKKIKGNAFVRLTGYNAK